jgi:hypothetical protein
VRTHQKRRAAGFVRALFRVANWFFPGRQKGLIQGLKATDWLQFEFIKDLLGRPSLKLTYGTAPLILKEDFSC